MLAPKVLGPQKPLNLVSTWTAGHPVTLKAGSEGTNSLTHVCLDHKSWRSTWPSPAWLFSPVGQLRAWHSQLFPPLRKVPH